MFVDISSAKKSKRHKGSCLGYDNYVKVYRIWTPEENKVIIERNVIFTGKPCNTIDHHKYELLYLPNGIESCLELDREPENKEDREIWQDNINEPQTLPIE